MLLPCITTVNLINWPCWNRVLGIAEAEVWSPLLFCQLMQGWLPWEIRGLLHTCRWGWSLVAMDIWSVMDYWLLAAIVSMLSWVPWDKIDSVCSPPGWLGGGIGYPVCVYVYYVCLCLYMCVVCMLMHIYVYCSAVCVCVCVCVHVGNCEFINAHVQ